MQNTSTFDPVIQLLVNAEIISRDEASRFQAEYEAGGADVVDVLTDSEIVTESQVYELVAEHMGFPFIDPRSAQLEPNAIAALDGEWAKKLSALPISIDGEVLNVAVANPKGLHLLEDIQRLTGRTAVFHLAPPKALQDRLNREYRDDPTADELVQEIVEEPEDDLADDAESSSPIIRYVNSIIQQAVMDRASDIHIVPAEKDIVVKNRIDGVLYEQMRSAKNLLPQVVSRIKVLAGLNISEKRLPQDGRITLTVAGRRIDLRVATIPTIYGEQVVLRIIDSSTVPKSITELGMSADLQKLYKEHYTRPSGLVLVTGPTGSGKTITLKVTIEQVKSPELNIVSIEDPVEHRVEGIQQIQINESVGLTFPKILRSVVRADPDIIFIGEIRDQDTAKIAIEAALTGHLVFATLHTNNAVGAISRLTEMGVAPYLIGTVTNLSVAQRLVRRLCENCKEAFVPTVELLNDWGFPSDGELPTIYKPVGCDRCREGYIGRVAIYEMLALNSELKHMVSTQHATSDVLTKAKTLGFETLKESGWSNVLAGTTSVEEILRVAEVGD